MGIPQIRGVCLHQVSEGPQALCCSLTALGWCCLPEASLWAALLPNPAGLIHLQFPHQVPSSVLSPLC